MLDVNEMLMVTLYLNCCIMAKDAQNKNSSLKINELNELPNVKNSEEKGVSHLMEALKTEEETLENHFPIQSFPQPLQDVLVQTKACLLFPVDYTGTAILFAASVAIGNTHRVVIKKGFDVPCVLYCALVGKAGATKSHPLSFAIKPLVKRESSTFRSYNETSKKFKEYSEMSKEEKKGAEKVEMPFLNKILMQDFTPESLQNCHYQNPRGLGACNDELLAWVNNFNRYTKGSAEQFWLSNHSGTFTDNLRADKYIRIEKCFVSVIGTIQPELLKSFSEGRIHNGFLDRILFAYPFGLKKEKWNRNELSDETINNYDKIISSLLDIPYQEDPKYVHFDKAAEDKLYEWQATNTDIANAADAVYETGICNKLDTIMPRIALILQLLQDSVDGKTTQLINLQSVIKAIDLVEYYRMGAKRAYSEILGTSVNDKKDLKKLKEEQKKTAVELHKNGKSLSEIATILFGDDRKKSLIQVWVKNVEKK
jgi:Protein of unknown function (DUF3987)